MCLCLLLLTGMNFFTYPVQSGSIISTTGNSGSTKEKDPRGPVEEKSSNNSSSSIIQEEYLHENEHKKELTYLSQLIHDKILEAEKLQIVHYELVSPPPKA